MRGSQTAVLAAALLACATGSVFACGGDDVASSSSSSGSSSGDPPEDGGVSGGDAAVSSSGGPCTVANAGAAPKGWLAKQKLVVAGVKDPGYANRTYNLLVPAGHDGSKTFPLVFELHGNGGDGAGMRKTLDLETASAGGAILVYPDGFGGWDLESAPDKNDDIKFVRALIDTIGKTYCVDTSRVFATGYSNGGYFANQLACKVGAAVFRGIASHAGGGPYGADAEYDDQGNLICAGKPVAALISHGTSDGSVALSEGKSSRDEWKRVNGCKDATDPFDPSPCVAYQGCAAGRPVVYCEVPGLGHVPWPEGGAKATWSFLSKL